MFDGSTPVTPPLLSALRASGFVGTWETNVPSGRSVLDAGAAEVMAGDRELAGQPIALEAALARIHPEDRAWVFERITRVRRTGGVIDAEFRILTGTGDIRWIRTRGHLTTTAGGIHGCGTYTDVTETRPDFEILSRPALHVLPPADPLGQAADHALATRAAIDRTGQPRLRFLVDALLWEMGRALARRERA